jgi:hypothetical protein
MVLIGPECKYGGVLFTPTLSNGHTMWHFAVSTLMQIAK